MSRREKIEAMLAEEPNDTFLRYALAMEFKSEGDLTTAIAKMTELTKLKPPHVPAYFMAAQYSAEDGETEQARTLLRDGIEEARRQGDHHAAGEMSEFLQMLGDVA